jgi:hypothetical protein
MVETAVRLAHAVEILPQQLSERESSVAEAAHPEVFEGQFLSDLVVEEEVRLHPEHQAPEMTAAAALESPLAEAVPHLEEAPQVTLPEPPAQTSPVRSGAPEAPAGHVSANKGPAKKLLFWSAAGESELTKASDADQSHVPPVLRGLRKCEACGFPISAGRILCVECEEKKWRGQLRQAPNRKLPTGITTVPAAKSTGGAFSAAAVSMAKNDVPTQYTTDAGSEIAMVAPQAGLTPTQEAGTTIVTTTIGEIAGPAETPQLILSAGLDPSRSWFSANKYVVLTLLVIGAGAAAFLLLR